MEVIEIARILKPHGIRGEIKAQHFCDNSKDFLGFEKVYFKEKNVFSEKKVLESRADNTHVYLLLEGINTRNEADSLRGRLLYVEKSAISDLPENRFLIRDLIGSKVLNEKEKELGVLSEILQHGAVDVYCVKSIDNGFMFPALKRVIIKVDIEEKTIHVDAKALSEVSVYDV